ncbi:hypothetical protein ATC03_01720 [Agromyces aureus]|uniref:Fido domain-containing protein n=2 Tax=Agromyces aureus TaxID=453304 RepID=A0A191WBN5_9MICO|nr:hypothetical protein ATC03_01720 [Agromyces aureus]
MSVVSARIEGNHTTVYDALDRLGSKHGTFDDSLREIVNIAETARFIDELDPAAPLTHSLIRELHARTVSHLIREGDPNPGNYREVDVAISNSQHTPPSWVVVHPEMTDLLDFANAERPLHEQMLQIAIAHHRFVWIHPFQNGNGRVSRLFTYAMLRRTIFNTRGGSALNPMAVFGNDRDAYISALEGADDLSERGTTAWIEFFATGISTDLQRLIRLQDHEYVSEELITPVLTSLARDGVISAAQAGALAIALQRGVVKAGDLEAVFPGSPAQRSRAIRTLVEEDLFQNSVEGPRFYRISLSRGPIAARLVRRLDTLGYLPKILADD